MFDLSRFGLSDTFELSAALPDLAAGATTLEAAADRVVEYLCDHIVDKATGRSSVALAQCFITRPFGELPSRLQDTVINASPHPVSPQQPCLVLLVSGGDERARRDGRVAGPPAAVAVGSPAAQTLAPAVADVVERLVRGAASGGTLRRTDAGSYAVGYVGDARGCEILAGWDGVTADYDIESVLSITAFLASDHLVTVVLYSKSPIPEPTADAFTAVALGLKVAMLPYAISAASDLEVVGAQNAALSDLLRVRHEIALAQSARLERALERAERAAAELAASEAALARSEARMSAIVRTALDAVVLMDSSGRVVEWNPAAESIFGFSRDEAVGALVSELMIPDDLRDRHSRGLARYLVSGDGPLLNQRVEITALRRDGTTFPVELSIAPVPGVHGSPVFTAFIRDITERMEHQEALLASRENFAHIARTLQRSLLPAALPYIAGLDLGAAFHPSRAGSDVGGDFYDVFRLSRTDVFLTLGDVCGKGAEAAAITAIARHTVRAVASEARHPTQILRRLNDALTEHDIGERFCSMVAARAVPIVRGMRLAVCCAGHPAPMVVRADGALERVGVAGDLLGLFPDVRLFEETVQLNHGDTLVLFTDGVTEAIRGREQFGEERLGAVLLESLGHTATEMVNHLLEAVLAFGGYQSRDDIAILAVKSAPEPGP